MREDIFEPTSKNLMPTRTVLYDPSKPLSAKSNTVLKTKNEGQKGSLLKIWEGLIEYTEHENF